jgi:hypothetical protein
VRVVLEVSVRLRPQLFQALAPRDLEQGTPAEHVTG